MIFSLLIIHNHDRKSPITRVPRTATWMFLFNSDPSFRSRFRLSSKVVREAITTDINNLVQEFWRTSNDEAVGASLFEMRRLHEILEGYLQVS